MAELTYFPEKDLGELVNYDSIIIEDELHEYISTNQLRENTKLVTAIQNVDKNFKKFEVFFAWYRWDDEEVPNEKLPILLKEIDFFLDNFSVITQHCPPPGKGDSGNLGDLNFKDDTFGEYGLYNFLTCFRYLVCKAMKINGKIVIFGD